jgi:hypothetical protein
MAENTRRRNILIALLVLVIVIILLLLSQCLPKKPAPVVRKAETPPSAPVGTEGSKPSAPVEPAAKEPDEVLGAATLKAPERVGAGTAFVVEWTGPDNSGDYVTIVKSDAAADVYANYRDTKEGASLELTAPIEAGAYEVRYVTKRSHTILGRAKVEVVAAEATLDAVATVVLGSKFFVSWTGPNNQGDYITIVEKDAPDAKYVSYEDTTKGSPLTLTAPTETGDVELRYVSGQGRKVLARRPIKVIAAEVTLAGPAEAIAGTMIEVVWTGPNNTGDYITLVPQEMADGKYGNYANTSVGSPMKLLVPIMAGNAELRYMTGQGHKVLGRRPIKIVAAQITMSAPPECAAGTAVSVTWTGPNNPGDYITIVAKELPDGQFGDYANTASGSPLSVKAPKTPGDAEIRYMTGQGAKVLARIAIKVVP